MQTKSFSHRYELLLDLLRSLSKDSRVIVFVRSRKAVRSLHESITIAVPCLNALCVVGHGGPDGMDWADGQETAISSLREGTSQLLICTSVLEEGLDVTDCDIVVRFSGYTSLIQYIQSRGRARSTKGRMVMILSEEERCRVTEIENQERILHSTLQSFALSGEMPSYKGLEIARQFEIKFATSSLSKDNVSQIYNYLDGQGLKIRIGWEADKEKEGDILAVEIFVIGSIDTEDLAVSIEENLTGCVVSRCEALNAANSPAFLGLEVTVILLQLKSKLFSGGQGLSAANHYDQLIRTWDFLTTVISRSSEENEGRAGRQLKVLSKIYRQLEISSISSVPDAPVPIIEVIRVRVGWLSDPHTFIPGDHLSVPYTGAYWENSSCLHIISNVGYDVFRLSFELRSLHGFALMSSDRLDGFTTFYLPLLYPPIASHKDPMGENIHSRISINAVGFASPLANDLAAFATCPVVAITVSMHDRFHLLSSYLTGYDTRVSTISYSTIPSEVILSHDCQWYIDILQCNRDNPIAPHSVRNLKEKVANICGKDQENNDQAGESIALAVLKQLSALICVLPAYWMDYLTEFDLLIGSYLMHPLVHIDR
jgi:hypothetical protein